MNCELCGKETSQTTTVSIENSEIEVCEQCKEYGKEIFTSDKVDSSKEKVLKRIRNKKKRGSSSSLDSGSEKELAFDYAERIEQARIDQDLTQEELAKQINEKRSVIAKLEKSDMRPSKDLRHKLEQTLDIELMEEIEATTTERSEDTGGLTIGDLIDQES